MVLLDGKKLSEEIINNLKKEIQSRRLKLQLAVILVGQDQASQIFVNQKKKACERVGIGFKLFNFPAEIGSLQLKGEIEKIIRDPANSGVIIQLPLPEQLVQKTQELLNLVPPEKDADVLSERSFEKFARGELSILPPTVGAVFSLFKKYNLEIKGKNIVIIGAGPLVGKPLAAWLKLKGAKFSLLDKTSQDISAYLKEADILITGTGEDKIIKGSVVKEGVVAIDFARDLDFKSVAKKASYITPVPGGVGPMTVACLLENLVKLNG